MIKATLILFLMVTLQGCIFGGEPDDLTMQYGELKVKPEILRTAEVSSIVGGQNLVVWKEHSWKEKIERETLITGLVAYDERDGKTYELIKDLADKRDAKVLLDDEDRVYIEKCSEPKESSQPGHNRYFLLEDKKIIEVTENLLEGLSIPCESHSLITNGVVYTFTKEGLIRKSKSERASILIPPMELAQLSAFSKPDSGIVVGLTSTGNVLFSSESSNTNLRKYYLYDFVQKKIVKETDNTSDVALTQSGEILLDGFFDSAKDGSMRGYSTIYRVNTADRNETLLNGLDQRMVTGLAITKGGSVYVILMRWLGSLDVRGTQKDLVVRYKLPGN